jgi:molybdate transport system substrate-binding protein
MRGTVRPNLLRCVAALLAAVLSASCEQSSGDGAPVAPTRQPVEVFVVASLEPMVTAAIDRYAPNRDPLDFIIRPGSSQSLARQVQAGARVDLIISANPASLQAAEPAPRAILPWVVDRLVVVAPTGSAATLRDFDFGQSTIAVANETTDLGLHTRLAMRSRETWSDSQGRLIRQSNAADVLAAVAAGDAELGVVQATDAAGPAAGLRIVGDLDLPDSVELDYFLASYSDPGDRLASWLAGPDGAALAQEWGYEPASP